jgi:hypothetical protein
VPETPLMEVVNGGERRRSSHRSGNYDSHLLLLQLRNTSGVRRLFTWPFDISRSKGDDPGRIFRRGSGIEAAVGRGTRDTGTDPGA